MKVFDYSNNQPAAKVIDYGHKSGDGNPIEGPSGPSPADRIPEFRAVKTFEYGHSSFSGPNRMGIPGGMGMGMGGGPNQGMTGCGPNRGMTGGPGGGPGAPNSKRKNKKRNRQKKEERLQFQQNPQLQSNSFDECNSSNPGQDEVSGQPSESPDLGL